MTEIQPQLPFAKVKALGHARRDIAVRHSCPFIEILPLTVPRGVITFKLTESLACD